MTVTCRLFMAGSAVPPKEPGLVARQESASPLSCCLLRKLWLLVYISCGEMAMELDPSYLIRGEHAPRPRFGISESLGTVKMHDRDQQNQRGGPGPEYPLSPGHHVYRDRHARGGHCPGASGSSLGGSMNTYHYLSLWLTPGPDTSRER